MRSAATNEPNEVELGWVVIGSLDDVDRQAVEDARQVVLETVSAQFPQYEWRLPLRVRGDIATDMRVEPMTLLEYGVGERDARGWDFVIVITSADLIGHSKPHVWATPSSATAVGVLSTAQIDPRAVGEEVDASTRAQRLSQRIATLALHLLGDLCGLEHRNDNGTIMAQVHSIDELDNLRGFAPASVRALSDALANVADLRLEERRRPPGRARFYAQTARMNATIIGKTIRRVRPWSLPLRMRRFMIAAFSAMVLLLVTAETWELAMHLPALPLVSISLASLITAIVYIATQQRLFMPAPRRTTEQVATAHLAIGLSLITAIAVAYIGLFALTLFATITFPSSVVDSWSKLDQVHYRDQFRMAAMVAAACLAIAALGGSFEQRSQVRHMAYVDEEI